MLAFYIQVIKIMAYLMKSFYCRLCFIRAFCILPSILPER